MKFSVNVETTLDEQKVIKGLVKTLADAMFFMEKEAVRMCPVDTGRLRNSIHTEKVDDFHWFMADGVDYGIYQEFGTIRMRAQPFFRPALDFTKLKVPELLARNM